MGIIFPVNGKWGYLSHNFASEVASPLLKGGFGERRISMRVGLEPSGEV